MESFSVAQDQAEVDVRSYRQLADEYERRGPSWSALANLLAGRREDRMAANQRFRSAAEVLDQVGLDLSQPHGEWPRLLDQVHGRRRRPRAGRAAGPRGHPAGRPGAGGDRGGGPLDRPGPRVFRHGRRGGHLGRRRPPLSRAEQLLGAQQYEQAIESAGQAQLAARRAHQDAVQQAIVAADAGRRRTPAMGGRPRRLRDGGCAHHGRRRRRGRHPGQRRLGRRRGRSPAPPDMPEPAISPEPPPTDTSVSSWESDTGQSSW